MDRLDRAHGAHRFGDGLVAQPDDPVIPPGNWHGLFSGLFVVVVWPSLTWLLRSFAWFGFWDLLSWFC
jgi:hypothetical protein